MYNTAGLPPCGYTIELFTNDRTIVGLRHRLAEQQQFCRILPGRTITEEIVERTR